MSVEKLLTRLHGVKKVGEGKWNARCPAHADKSPSLAIKDEDGTTLCHCFAGCSTADVLAAVGLQLSDLYPEKPVHHRKGKRSFDAYHSLRALADDALVVQIAARMVIRKEPLAESDMKRLNEAVGRLQDARTFVLGDRS